MGAERQMASAGKEAGCVMGGGGVPVRTSFSTWQDSSSLFAGHISLDGEPVHYGPIQAEIHPRLLRIYGPP